MKYCQTCWLADETLQDSASWHINKIDMKKDKKNVDIDSEKLLKGVALGSVCVAVASLLLPAAPVAGGLECVCAKTIPSLLRGHVFF